MDDDASKNEASEDGCAGAKDAYIGGNVRTLVDVSHELVSIALQSIEDLNGDEIL